MSHLGSLKHTYLVHFSQPATDRILYREIDKQPVRSILEIGIGNAVRAERLLAIAKRNAPGVEIAYTGIDRFEDGPSAADRISLKQAYRQLRQPQVKVQLAPGDPLGALSRISNNISGVDLVVIAADQDADSLAEAWMFLPRMIHSKTRIFRQSRAADGKLGDFAEMSLEKLDELAFWRRRKRRVA